MLRHIQEIRTESERSRLVEEIANRLNPLFTHPSSPVSICYEIFDRILWQELFTTSSRVDIVVHYFDTWINNNFSSLQDFFNRGGIVRLTLPNYENASLVRVIKERFPEFAEDQVKTKIQQTFSRFSNCLQSSRHRHASLETHYINEMILYCGIRFDDRILVLSMYEHIRELHVSNPGFVIPLNQYPNIREWFDREFTGLIAKHVNP